MGEFPKQFGPYLLLDNLAHGGMGAVYLAMHGGIAGANRLCVLKKLRTDLTKSAEYTNRFIDEARIVMKLNHASICNAFDVGCVGNEYFLAMDYVSGISVRELFNRAVDLKKRVPTDVVLWLVSRLADGLDYAHRHKDPFTGEPLNLIHRDVSPQNVMVNWEGEVKLIDFGLATSELKVEQTGSGTVLGKLAYMSPEQARGDALSGSCDLFAAGVIAYELFTNERWYDPLPQHAIWQIAGKGDWVPEKWSALEPDIKTLLVNAVAPNAADRFPACGDFSEVIGTYLAKRHPTTNQRTVRELLDEWFAQDKVAERGFVGRFADLQKEASSPQPATNPGIIVDRSLLTESIPRRQKTSETGIATASLPEPPRARTPLFAGLAGAAALAVVAAFAFTRHRAPDPAPPPTAAVVAPTAAPLALDPPLEPLTLSPPRPPTGHLPRGHGHPKPDVVTAPPKDETPPEERAALAGLKAVASCPKPCATRLRKMFEQNGKLLQVPGFRDSIASCVAECHP